MLPGPGGSVTGGWAFIDKGREAHYFVTYAYDSGRGMERPAYQTVSLCCELRRLYGPLEVVDVSSVVHCAKCRRQQGSEPTDAAI